MRIRPRKWKTGKGYQLDLGIDPKTKKRKRMNFKTWKDGRDWYKKNIKDEANKPPGEIITVGEAGDAWVKAVKADKRARATWKKYEEHVKHHIKPTLVDEIPFGDYRTDEVTTPLCDRFKTALQDKGLSPTMVGKVMGSVRMMFNRSAIAGHIAGNPAAPIRAKRGERHKKPVVIPTPEQITKMMELLNKHNEAITFGQAWVDVAATSGMRPGEQRAITWPDILFTHEPPSYNIQTAADDQGVIGPPKSRAGYRKVPIPPSVVPVLKRWQKVCPKSRLGLVFPSSAGHVQDLSNIHKRVWFPIMQALGFVVKTGRKNKADEEIIKTLFTPYALRHFFASMLIRQQRMQPKQVQQLMGHESIQLTMDIYGHLWEDVEENRRTAGVFDLLFVTSFVTSTPGEAKGKEEKFNEINGWREEPQIDQSH